MGILDIPYCPNIDCDQQKLRDGEICPKCGNMAKKFGVKEAMELLERKWKKGDILISEAMTDDEIQKRIYGDMTDLAKYITGTGRGHEGTVETLLTKDPKQQVIESGLKALITENKIIIRQNELILRTLNKLVAPPDKQYQTNITHSKEELSEVGMPMMRCPKCGTLNYKGSKLCSKCNEILQKS